MAASDRYLTSWRAPARTTRARVRYAAVLDLDLTGPQLTVWADGLAAAVEAAADLCEAGLLRDRGRLDRADVLALQTRTEDVYRSAARRLGTRAWPYDRVIHLDPAAWPAPWRAVSGLPPEAPSDASRPVMTIAEALERAGGGSLAVTLEGLPGASLAQHRCHLRVEAEVGPAVDRDLRRLMTEIAPGRAVAETYMRPLRLSLAQQRSEQPRID